MNLLIDIGNTRIKWAYLDGGQLGEIQALGHEAFFDSLNEATMIAARPERVVVACVGRDTLRARLMLHCANAWSLACDFMVSRAQGSGVSNAYSEPQRLGVDRWLAVCAARGRTSGAFMVIDAGSALTLDHVSAQGQHLGGLIVPGLAMAVASLLAGTEQVRFRESDARRPQARELFGRDTESAVQYGSLWSAVSLIEGMRAKIEASLGTPVSCFLTGGDAALLHDYLSGTYLLTPSLVLEGLAIEAGLRING